MADKSLAQVRNRVLEKLFVLIAGETASAEDAATVETVIANTNEELRELGLCYWEDTATPQALVETLAAFYASFLANDFMDAQEAAIFKQDMREPSLKKLRELLAVAKKYDTPTQATYF